jgi:hypothetical protein
MFKFQKSYEKKKKHMILKFLHNEKKQQKMNQKKVTKTQV